MKTETKKLTTIPFSGFYGTYHSYELDTEAEQLIEWEREENDTEIEWFALEYDHIPYAQAYAQAFNNWLTDATGFDCGLTFESLQSPKEYNFTTDKIYCHISPENALRLFRWVRDNCLDQLNKTIKDRFTSYDGFISFYPDNLNNWPDYICDWDHNQIGTLLECIWQNYAEDDGSQWAEFDLMESALCNGLAGECVLVSNRETI
ncbi:MAG: hypothetical protein H7842_14210 [Gammaproteobacteria bacterium SHHR-1]